MSHLQYTNFSRFRLPQSGAERQLGTKKVSLIVPLRQNMEGAELHNNWRMLTMRRTIKTRFSELCTLFDMETNLCQRANWTTVEG